MRTALKIVICGTAIALFAATTAISAPLAQLLPENSFISFTTERIKVSAFLSCTKPRLYQGYENNGAMYACTGGKAGTVSIYVNELPNSGGKVKHVKYIWNDYTKNIGDGLHADAKVAKEWAGYLADMYAPDQKAQVLKAFQGNKNVVIKSKTNVLTYTYDHGPVADERMYVVTRK